MIPCWPIVGALMAVLVCSTQGTIAQCQVARVIGTDGANDAVGFAVAGSANALVVGAPGDDQHGTNAGAVYILEPRAWDGRQPVRLTLPGAATGDAFGWALAADGARMVVTAAGAEQAGFVYEQTGTPDWVLVARLSDPNPGEIDFFGCSGALDGAVAVVGAPQTAPDGAAYVFERDESGTWTQTARLTPADSLAWHFGESVAVDGDIALIGAPDDFEQGSYAGSAYVFERNPDGSWSQTAKLLPAQGHSLQSFGAAVAVDGQVILVGASFDNTDRPFTGAVYAFERDAGGAWQQTARFVPDDAENSDLFGISVALEADLAVVGAENYAGTFLGYGAAFIYQRQPNRTWRLVGRVMADDPQDGSDFGHSVALSGNLAVVGAPFHDVVTDDGQTLVDAGAAYVFAVGPDEDGDGMMDACVCPGDVDGDFYVGLDDLMALLRSFGLDAAGDLDADADTDLTDLAVLLSNWERVCP